MRGFHYKKKPSREHKIISCLTGSLINSSVDLRKESRTFMKNFSITLKASDRYILIVPPLCATAFLTLENNTTVHYYMGDYFNPNTYSGIRFDDPFFSVKWPHKPVYISSRDLQFPDFVDD